MLNKKNKKTGSILYEEGTCSDMLKLIKKRHDKKTENLEEAVNSVEKINHLFTGLSKTHEKKSYDGTQNEDVD